MFFHSSSYTANPIACAVALENTHIWRDEPVQDRIDHLVQGQAKRLANLKDHPGFANLRQSGTIVALDVKVKDQGYLSEIAPSLYDYFHEHDVLLRPLGNTVYILPPYCLTEADLDKIYHVVSNAPDLLGL
jgi:adenosylmethionine-8-amino-7-oxononanoate aminotransferase